MLYSRLVGVSLCLGVFMLTFASRERDSCAARPPARTTPFCGRALRPPDPCDHPLLQLDAQAQALHRNFTDLLTRYDCSQPYSIKFTCQHCKEAYKSWVCSVKLKYWQGWRSIKPCRSVCHKVEQMCPFFLPSDKLPAHYAGEPSFLCLDPNIEETTGQEMNSTYGGADCCFEECDEAEDGICVRGNCEQGESGEGPSSSGHCSLPPLLVLSALSLLLVYRTRLDI